jgi:hypothetical protein
MDNLKYNGIHHQFPLNYIYYIKTLNYCIFKETFIFEQYFDILDEKDFLTLCKFRTTNHKLPIEHGRWNNGTLNDTQQSKFLTVSCYKFDPV